MTDSLRCATCGAEVERGALDDQNRSMATLVVWRDGEAIAYCPDHADLRTPEQKPSVSDQIDTLAGQRKAVLDGKDSLLWPPSDEPPVRVGEEFELRTIRIRITSCQLLRQRGKHWGWWRAEFDRIVQEPAFFLGKRGYTHDPDEAIKAQDDEAAPTLDTIGWHARSEESRAVGVPPEPEGINPAVVAELPSTEAARRRWERAHDDQRQVNDALSLGERVRLLELLGGNEARRQLRAIRAQVAEGERRAGLRKAS